MEKKKANKVVKLVLKIGLTALALFLVSRKVDFLQVKDVILNSKILWLIPALVFFNISKIISAFRLNVFFDAVECKLKTSFNLRLYYIGMFYNLFLPGGVGGDGYKIVVLKRMQKGSVKDLVAATLIDRISGLTVLVFLTILFVLFTSLKAQLGYYEYLFWLAAIVIFPLMIFAVKKVFPKFKEIMIDTSFYSLGVQVSQIIAAFFIMMALGINTSYADYLSLFLVSSIITIVPVFMGGLGARESVFGFGAAILPIDENLGVAIGLIFFILTALSSFSGVFFKVKQKEI